MIVGAFNFIDGIVAILNPHYFAIQPSGYGSAHLVVGDLTAWGWTIMILGVIQVLVAFGIFARQSWAAVAGIIVAGINAISQLLYLGVNPWWSIIAIGVDILIIYGLAVYGFTPRAEVYE
jgi:hypothetical protein